MKVKVEPTNSEAARGLGKRMFSRGLRRSLSALESFSNDDGDSNENIIKAKSINNQNNNSARALHFLVHLFAVTARLGR